MFFEFWVSNSKKICFDILLDLLRRIHWCACFYLCTAKIKAFGKKIIWEFGISKYKKKSKICFKPIWTSYGSNN